MGNNEAESLALLSERAADGDRDAFRIWLERTHARVYRLALRKLGSRIEAEEVIQETYSRAWQQLSSLRDHSASMSWLYQITRHVTTDRLRKQMRSRSYVFDDDGVHPDRSAIDDFPSDEPCPEEQMIRAQRAKQVLEWVGSLGEKHRTVLLLREVDDLSYEEIGEALGIPVGTVESRLHRARKKLAERFRRELRQTKESKS